MGTDNLFHKRKARQVREVKRQAAKRQPYDRVLIVCEDSDSVPGYLEAVCDNLRLTNVKICGKECGSAPSSVVSYAKERKKNYDKTYCVIDSDQHESFSKALQKAKDNKMIAIVSIPCFEYWLLLHFKYASQPFQAAKGSHCEQVIKDLKENLRNYEKSGTFLKRIYSKILREKQDTAIKHAKQRVSEYQDERLENKNPYTEMHILMEYLMNLGRKVYEK